MSLVIQTIEMLSGPRPPEGARLTVSVEEIRELRRRMREINSYPLKNISFTENGKPLEIAEGSVEEWRFTGMSNVDFIDLEFYKESVLAEAKAELDSA